MPFVLLIGGFVFYLTMKGELATYIKFAQGK
jgi:hypothetical protein